MEILNNKTTNGKGYNYYINNVGPKMAKKSTELFKTEGSVKIETTKGNAKDVERMIEMDGVIDALLLKGKTSLLTDADYKTMVYLAGEKVLLEKEMAKENQVVEKLSFDVKDINGKIVNLEMVPTLINSKGCDWDKHTLYKFKLPENCYIYMRKTVSLDFLRTIEIIEPEETE